MTPGLFFLFCGLLLTSAVLEGGAGNVVLFGLPALFGMGYLGTQMLAVFRFSAWLEGTTLAVQNAYRVSRHDLARTNVVVTKAEGDLGALRLARYGLVGEVVGLVGWEPGPGRSLQLPLFTGEGHPLPGGQLTALADAIAASDNQHRGEPAEEAIAALRKAAAHAPCA